MVLTIDAILRMRLRQKFNYFLTKDLIISLYRSKAKAIYYMFIYEDEAIPELSTGPDGPAGRVGSRFCRILAGRVGSGQHFGFFSFLLIISWYLNPL